MKVIIIFSTITPSTRIGSKKLHFAVRYFVTSAMGIGEHEGLKQKNSKNFRRLSLYLPATASTVPVEMLERADF